MQGSQVISVGLLDIERVNTKAVAVTEALSQRSHSVEIGHLNGRNHAMCYTFDSCLRTYYGG